MYFPFSESPACIQSQLCIGEVQQCISTASVCQAVLHLNKAMLSETNRLHSTLPFWAIRHHTTSISWKDKHLILHQLIVSLRLVPIRKGRLAICQIVMVACTCCPVESEGRVFVRELMRLLVRRQQPDNITDAGETANTKMDTSVCPVLQSADTPVITA